MMQESLGAAWDRLVTAVAGRRVVPRLPAGSRATVPESDAGPECAAGEDAVAGGAEASPVPLALFIRYRDAKGAESHRRITVRQLIGDPPEMLLAFCHEREAPRNFRFDRILEVASAETGELYTVVQLARLLGESGYRSVPARLRRAINVLVFLMRCDASEDPAEWLAIDDWLANFLVRFGGDDADHARAMAMARQVAPDSDDFLIGMRSFARADDAAELGKWLFQAIGAVIAADGSESYEEAYWTTEAYDFIAAMAGKAHRPARKWP